MAELQGDDDLQRRYDAYRQDHAAWRTACRSGDPLLLQVSAGQLLQSRVALYRALQASGWQAPPAERAALERDAALVEFDRLEERTVIDLVEAALAR